MSTKEEEFKSLYAQCHDSFVRYCSALAYGRLDVEDLVQDVLLSAWRNFDQIREKDKFLHYLMRAAKNRLSSFWRKPKYKEELVEKHGNRLMAQGVSPETLLDIELLYRLLDRLPDKQRQAIVLFEISGFSMKEIADLQDSSEGAVKTLVSRGRERLRAMMNATDKSAPLKHALQSLQSITLL